MKKKARLADLYNGVAEKMRIDFEDLTALIPHPGERGAGREAVIRGILSKYLPKRYAVDTGFVVDTRGSISNEIDVVIFDSGITPIFEILDGQRFFPCETVAAVGEIKSSITSRRELGGAMENLKSVKLLNRSVNGDNRALFDHANHPNPARVFDPGSNYTDQIFGFIFTARSMKRDTILEEIRGFNSSNPRKLWPNLFISYSDFLISYETTEGLQPSPMDATHLYCTSDSERKKLFLLFYGILYQFLCEARVVSPVMHDYLGIEYTKIQDFDMV